jgi:hypothetical protein
MYHKTDAEKSPRTLAASNPAKARHPKPFRVSYYNPAEVDDRGFALLTVVEVQAKTAKEAKAMVIGPDKHFVSAYKAVSMKPISEKKRHIYTLSPNYVPPKGVFRRGATQAWFRKYPICRRPGCGKQNPKWHQYCSDTCSRMLRNGRQLQTKARRMRVGKKNGIILCKCCAARPVGSFSDTRCNKCFLDTRTYALPRKNAERLLPRLQGQIPAVMEIMLNAAQHKCTRAGDTKGARFPKCGCRLHAFQWLVINAERLVNLRRPKQSYVMSNQPLPPWFQPKRKRRDFRLQNYLSSIQPSGSLAS